MTYASYTEFQPAGGKGDDLLAALTEAAAQMTPVAACLHYLVGRNVATGAIGVWEVWTGKDGHDASLEDPQTRALITQTMPLISGINGPFVLDLDGGKGFPEKV
ncbi:MAG: hypothetical protein QM589_03385 [Thermomicrobiales bacterium]